MSALDGLRLSINPHHQGSHRILKNVLKIYRKKSRLSQSYQADYLCDIWFGQCEALDSARAPENCNGLSSSACSLRIRMSRYTARSDGKVFPPFWTKGMLDTTQYKNLLAYKVFPALNRTYGVGKWCWTQDGAPCHTSNATQKYIENKLGSKGFWSKELWPPNSPNLNPLDYFMWSAVESKACATYHPNVDALKASVTKEWYSLPKAIVKSVCRKFRSRIEACIAAEGGIFEKNSKRNN